ncbi:MAG: hypothetical protein HUU29_06930 [Planctomycetaceae bacterium]|nr:hypothetical protein [Planctomycetaceae bacterium]
MKIEEIEEELLYAPGSESLNLPWRIRSNDSSIAMSDHGRPRKAYIFFLVPILVCALLEGSGIYEKLDEGVRWLVWFVGGMLSIIIFIRSMFFYSFTLDFKNRNVNKRWCFFCWTISELVLPFEEIDSICFRPFGWQESPHPAKLSKQLSYQKTYGVFVNFVKPRQGRSMLLVTYSYAHQKKGVQRLRDFIKAARTKYDALSSCPKQNTP